MKANKYPKIENLPDNAQSVATYAKKEGIAHAYVYVKFERSKEMPPKASVDYQIKNFQGINFVIPN